LNPLEILERLKAYLNNLKANWGWILLVMATMTGLFYLHGWSKPTFFTATTTFHPEAEKNVSSTEVSLPQLFTGMAQGDSEMTYMKGLLASKSLNRSLVADTVMFRDTSYLLADLIFEYQPAYSSLVSYLIHVINPDETDYHQLDLTRKIYFASSQVTRSTTLGTTPSGFAELRLSYYDSELAGLICEQYLKQLKYYYSNQKSLKAQQTIEFLEVRTDSIKRKLDSVNYALALSVDEGRFRLFARDEIRPTELQSTQSILSQMYVSLYVSQENVRAQQQRDLPVLQVIDPPMPPYETTKSNIALYIALGLIVGFLLGVLLVSIPMLRQDLRYIMQELVIKPLMEQAQAQPQGETQQGTSHQGAEVTTTDDVTR
jgi:hypothetical protein